MRFQPGVGPSRGLLCDCETDCETDGSFYSTNGEWLLWQCTGELLSDLLVNSCLRQTIMLHRQLSSSAVFSYIFSHSGSEVSSGRFSCILNNNGVQVQSSIVRNMGQVLGLLSRSNGPRPGQYGARWAGQAMVTMMVLVLISDLTSVTSVGVGMMSPSPGIVWRGDDLLYLWQLSTAQVWLQYTC